MESLGPIREELAHIVESSSSIEDVERRLAAFVDDAEQDEQLVSAIMVPAVQADMAGQLMVHEHERKEPIALGRRVALASDPRVPFLDLPWTEAIAEFRKRGLVSEDDLASLLQDYRGRSEFARKLLLKQLQERTMSHLVSALEEGTTLQQFAADMRETGAQLGISADNSSYLETVFRTNVQTAYGAGRFRAMTQPEVIEERPYVQYRTTQDSRVRDSHAELDGLIWRTNDPKWHEIAPPNGFNCRCSMVTLDPEEFEDEGGQAKLQSSVPPAGKPDAGFDRPPIALVKEDGE